MKLYKKQVRDTVFDIVGVDFYNVVGHWTDEDKYNQKIYREKLIAEYTKKYRALALPKFKTETRFVEVK